MQLVVRQRDVLGGHGIAGIALLNDVGDSAQRTPLHAFFIARPLPLCCQQQHAHALRWGHLVDRVIIACQGRSRQDVPSHPVATLSVLPYCQ